jgi:hypothetical protein
MLRLMIADVAELTSLGMFLAMIAVVARALGGI